jgi:hypothetical protein
MDILGLQEHSIVPRKDPSPCERAAWDIIEEISTVLQQTPINSR